MEIIDFVYICFSLVCIEYLRTLRAAYIADARYAELRLKRMKRREKTADIGSISGLTSTEISVEEK